MSAAAAPGMHELPEPLPDGETIVWHGRPCRRGLARDAFHIRALALYFALVVIVLAATSVAGGRTPAAGALALAPFAVGGLVVLAFVAWLSGLAARSTLYTITNRRVLMRIGMALPIHLNVPFSIIEGAGLRLDADGSGDIPIRLGGNGRIGYLHLWPHARPWHLRRPEPMLRAVPDAARVAELLAAAMAEAGAPAAVGAGPARIGRPAGTTRPDGAEAGLSLPPMAA